MKRSKLEDVEKFLTALVDYAVGQGVTLITHRMSDCGQYCLIGELLRRGGDPFWDENGGRAHGGGGSASRHSPQHVVDIIEGWDRSSWDGRVLPYKRLGRRLRTYYEGLSSKKQVEVNA